ncbi:flippase [Lactobacillus reuteri]|uniref:flippase n=1 Tax=Limosilactobacillus reuteri TaxID=1598 RepID=UPI00128D5FB1|nr:flippase [Limosilactobacillus reuteri]MQB94007.1 flippase [Limosilactobacillus reuteri]
MKVIRNYLYSASYQILLMLAPIITTPYVSRVLGPHNSGINSYTNSWVTFFYLFGQLGIALYGNREIAYVRKNRFERSKRFLEIELLQLIMSSIAFIFYILLTLFVFDNYKFYFLLQALWIIAYGLDISWYFMGMEDFKKTVMRNTLVKIFSILLIFILVRGKNDLAKYIFLLGFAQFTGSITLWPYVLHEVSWINLKRLHPFKHFKQALLLFIPTIITQIYAVVNRLMLGQMDSQSVLGQFDYGDKIVKIALAIVTATGTVTLPYVARKYIDGDTEGIKQSLYKSMDFVSFLSIPLMFGLMSISKKFAPWFLGSDYKFTGILIVIEAPVIIFIAWSNITGNQYLMATNKNKSFTLSVAIGAVVNVLLNFLFIKYWSAIGAMVATVISEAIVTAIQLLLMEKEINISKCFNSTWKYLLSGFVMFVSVNYLSNQLKMNILTLFIEVTIGIMIYGISLFIMKAPILEQGKILFQNIKQKEVGD